MAPFRRESQGRVSFLGSGIGVRAAFEEGCHGIDAPTQRGKVQRPEAIVPLGFDVGVGTLSNEQANDVCASMFRSIVKKDHIVVAGRHRVHRERRIPVTSGPFL